MRRRIDSLVPAIVIFLVMTVIFESGLVSLRIMHTLYMTMQFMGCVIIVALVWRAFRWTKRRRD